MKTRLLSVLLALALLISVVPAVSRSASAGAIVSINDSSVFLKQEGSNTCTLVAALMMFRRGALINKDTSWDTFTESAYSSSSWWGPGLPTSLSGGGMSASRVTIGEYNGKAAERKQLFRDLLKGHPEGVVIWLAYGNNASHWHAVLLTDYDSSTDTFYCADSNKGVGKGRIKLSASLLATKDFAGMYTGKDSNTQEDILTYIHAYWYIKSGINYDNYGNSATPPAMPSGLTGTRSGSANVQLKWNAVTNADYYEAQYSRAGVSWTTLDESPVSTTSLLAKNFSWNYDYVDFRVRAANSAGTSSWAQVRVYKSTSDEITLSSDFAVPNGLIEGSVTFKPKGTVKSESSNLTAVSAEIYDSSNKLVTGHIVSSGINSKSYDLSALSSKVNFSNLKSGTYRYKIMAKNSKYPDGVVLYNNNFTVAAPEQSTLDLNGLLDGVKEASISGYGTVDIYINGSLVANDVTDYYTAWPKGTYYEIMDIKPSDGCVYDGLADGSLSGTLDIDYVGVRLRFSTAAVENDTDGFLFDAETGTITGYKDNTVTELVIPEKIGGVAVTAIGVNAFLEFSNLANVTLPGSLKAIKERAFALCSSLRSITIPKSVTSVEQGAFDGCGSLSAIKVQDGSVSYASSNGVLYTKDMKTLVSFPGGKSGAFVIPNGVTRIEAYAVASCASLTNITIPNTVTTIGDNAFARCTSLTNVTIPDSVNSIGYWVFDYCTSLKNATISGGIETLLFGTFYGCTNLKTVSIPKSVTTIEDWVFNGCKNLTDVYYAGTEAQWNAIEIGKYEDGNIYLLNATKHFAEQEQKPQAITVIVDGKTVEWTDAAPFISNNRTLVPLRAVANALGLNVTWDGKARTAEFSGNATATDGKKYNVSVKFTIGSRRMAVKYSDSAKNETTDYIAIDSAPLIKNNRTYAPIRFLAEHFGYTVKWDKNTKTITITSGKISPPVFNFSGFANGTYDADMENATTVRKSDGSVETVLYLTRPVIIPDSVVKTLKVGSVINLGKYGGYGTLTLESFDRKSNYGHEWIELDEEHELYKLSNGDWILCDLFTGNEFKWIYKEIKVTVSKSVPVYDEYSYGPNSTKIRDLRDFFDRNSYVNFKSLGVTVTNGKISSIMIYFVPQA